MNDSYNTTSDKRDSKKRKDSMRIQIPTLKKKKNLQALSKRKVLNQIKNR